MPAEENGQAAPWTLVQPHHTSGRTRRCVACDVAIGSAHNILCPVLKDCVQTKYDGPDPTVECAYPPCVNRLRRADGGGDQWCSKDHRTLTLEVSVGF